MKDDSPIELKYLRGEPARNTADLMCRLDKLGVKYSLKNEEQHMIIELSKGDPLQVWVGTCKSLLNGRVRQHFNYAELRRLVLKTVEQGFTVADLCRNLPDMVMPYCSRENHGVVSEALIKTIHALQKHGVFTEGEVCNQLQKSPLEVQQAPANSDTRHEVLPVDGGDIYLFKELDTKVGKWKTVSTTFVPNRP